MIFFTFSAVIFVPKRIGRRRSADAGMLLCFKKCNVSPKSSVLSANHSCRHLVTDQPWTLTMSKMLFGVCLGVYIFLFHLLVLGFTYCLMVSWLFCFLWFTSSVSLTGSHTEGQPLFAPRCCRPKWKPSHYVCSAWKIATRFIWSVQVQ